MLAFLLFQGHLAFVDQSYRWAAEGENFTIVYSSRRVSSHVTHFTSLYSLVESGDGGMPHFLPSLNCGCIIDIYLTWWTFGWKCDFNDLKTCRMSCYGCCVCSYQFNFQWMWRFEGCQPLSLWVLRHLKKSQVLSRRILRRSLFGSVLLIPTLWV